MLRSKASQTTKPNSNNAVDRSRGLGLWKVAVNATKGLFGAQSSPAGDSPLSHSRQSESDIDRRPRIRRSTSSPSLKNSSSSDDELHKTSHSPIKHPRSLANLGRPIISPPSLPQRLQDLDNHSFNSKLSYPLTAVPSFPSINSPFHTSSGFSNPCSPFDKPSSLTRSLQNFNTPRRRTKSVPGTKLDAKALSLPNLTVTNDYPVVSPFNLALNTPPTPALETPKNPFDVLASPYKENGSNSPRSCSSVRRKPVPRYLYAESTDDDHSDGVPHNSTSMATPLLSSTELFRNAILHGQTNKKDLKLFPIGKGNTYHRPTSSGRGGPHRRSSSESARPSAAVPWSKQVIPQVSVIREISSSESDCEPLSPPPRQQTFPLPTSADTPDCHRLSSCEELRSNHSRSGALSPLTDDEILAIRTFLRKHAVGQRERLRRRRLGRTDLQHVRMDSESSTDSTSYDFHTDIVESYLSGECDSVSAGSESYEDGTSRSTDVSARSSASSSSILRGSTIPPFDGYDDDDEATVAFNLREHEEGEECGSDEDDKDSSHEGSLLERLELGDSFDCNRATFGYYDFPFGRSTGSPAKHMDANTRSFDSDSCRSSDSDTRVLAHLDLEETQSGIAYSGDSEDMDFPGNDSEETARGVVSAISRQLQQPHRHIYYHQEDDGGETLCESIENAHTYSRKESEEHHAVLRLVNCLDGAPSTTGSASTSSTSSLREHDSYYGDDDEECEGLLLPSASVLGEDRRECSLSGSDVESQSFSTRSNSDAELGKILAIPVEVTSFSGSNVHTRAQATSANSGFTSGKGSNLLPLLSALELAALNFDSDLNVDIGVGHLNNAHRSGTSDEPFASNFSAFVCPKSSLIGDVSHFTQPRGTSLDGNLGKDGVILSLGRIDSATSSFTSFDGDYVQHEATLPWMRHYGNMCPTRPRPLPSRSSSIDLGRRTPSDPIPITVLRPPSLKSAIHHSRSSSTASQLHAVAPFLSGCAPSPCATKTIAERSSSKAQPQPRSTSISSMSHTPIRSRTAFTLGNSRISPSTFRTRTKKVPDNTFGCVGGMSDYYGLVDEYGFTSRGSGEVETSNDQGQSETMASATCAGPSTQTKSKRGTRNSVRQGLKHLFTRSKSLSSSALGRPTARR